MRDFDWWARRKGAFAHPTIPRYAFAAAGPELEAELIGFCRDHLAHYKCPVSIDFMEELPRQPTGKLYKRLIRDRYWGDRKSRIV